MLADPPADEIGVLLQASAVLSEFMAAGKMDSADVIASIRDRYERGTRAVGPTADRFIAVSPPTAN